MISGTLNSSGSVGEVMVMGTSPLHVWPSCHVRGWALSACQLPSSSAAPTTASAWPTWLTKGTRRERVAVPTVSWE